MHRTHIHGLVIDSSAPIAAGREAPVDADVRPDLTVHRGPRRPVGAEPPPGEFHANVRAGSRGFAVVHTRAGWTIWFEGCAVVEVDEALTTAVSHCDPEFDEGLMDVLTAGFVLATILQLRGHVVLHASAVEVDDSAIAITGASGQGKSTLATLLCRAGGRLVTDDVLRVDLADNPSTTPAARQGATWTRLRDKAAELAVGGTVSNTADARLALELVPSTRDPLPLRAVLLPRPRRDTDDVQILPVTGSAALLALIAAPRIVGWSHPDGLSRQLRDLSRLVAAVPVFEAHVPWGPPFGDDLGARVLEALRRC